LLQQMVIGGVMVIPIGESGGRQVLQRVIRSENGYEAEDMELVSFVPFLSGRE
jgi:protein-L-isoaspartate(D-aspartate) O-methyltransferase